MRPDIGEILVDTPEMYEEAREFVQQVMPHNLRKLKHYTDDVPLFNRFQIESQIEGAYEREVRLPSGGALVIDQRSEEHTSELQSLMRTSYAVFCLKKKKHYNRRTNAYQKQNPTHRTPQFKKKDTKHLTKHSTK